MGDDYQGIGDGRVPGLKPVFVKALQVRGVLRLEK